MTDFKPHEECGVFGIYSAEKAPLLPSMFYGLYALQHRGQESVGISVSDGEKVLTHKALGMLNDRFQEAASEVLPDAYAAIGHLRYSTTGGDDLANAQPVTVRHLGRSFSVAHNGNLTNTQELRRSFELTGSVFQSTTDTEVIGHVITGERIGTDNITEAVSRAMGRIEGAYSLVVLTGRELVAARDPNGFRPLCYGQTEDGKYIVASEDCALAAVGAKKIREIDSGEIVTFSPEGTVFDRTHCNRRKQSICIFEYIYFARSDSIIGDCPVHKARLRAGAFLAESNPVEADVVVGVPDSGLDAAVGYAKESGIPYGIGIIRNKYIGRTFIAPDQSERENMVRIKLNPLAATVKDKRVVLIDDSIVRGTTFKRLVAMLRECGAKEVHIRIAAPPYMHPCYFGVDIDSENSLIANGHTVQEIADMLGADSLAFLPIKYLPYLISEKGDAGICSACFDGNYPIKVTPGSKTRFE